MNPRKKTVNLIFRNPKAGFSIDGVFKDLYQSNDNEFVFRVYQAPRHRAGLHDFLINLAWAYRLPDADIYHVTGDIHYCILSLIFKPTVLTIHDTVLLNKNRNPMKRLVYYFFWFLLPCLLARRITCITRTTQDSLKRLFPFKQMEVIYNAVPLRYNHSFRLFNKKNPVVLHIGTGWNKNLNNVIMALSGLDCFLRIIGEVDERIRKRLVDSGVQYSNAYDLTDEQMVDEYRNCDIVSFPSVFEGFGMPIVEAQSIGRVVVTSRQEPMLEVAGEGACYVDPINVKSLHDGFIRCITDDQFRETLIAKGKENITKFHFLPMRNAYARIYWSLIESQL